MLSDLGGWLLPRLDAALTGVHRFVRAWRAALEGDCWTELETAACPPACDGAA